MRYHLKDDPDRRLIEGRSPKAIVTALRGDWQQGSDLRDYMTSFRDRTRVAYGKAIARQITTKTYKGFVESLVTAGILIPKEGK